MYYQRRVANRIDHTAIRLSKKRKRSSDVLDIAPKVKHPRSIKRHKLLVRNEDGELREILPIDTLWYVLFIANPPRNKRLLKQFRLRFRMPYDSFLSLSDDLVKHEIFTRYISNN